jgi:hypothetical protein
MALRFVISVYHTGTWFVLETLKTSPDIVGDIVQSKYVSEMDLRKMRDADAKYLLHDHLGYAPRDPDFLNPLAIEQPIATPVRDPLLSLITRQARRPDLEHVNMIVAMLKLPVMRNRYNAYLVPVDRQINEQQRLALLQGLFGHMQITPPSNLEQLAAEWKWQNRTADSVHHDQVRLRSELGYFYNMRDYETLQRLLPVSTWALEMAQPQLQPFYEELGYEKLMWFK